MSALFLLWGILLAPPAHADEASCKRCCAAAGEADCSAQLRVVGEDSIVVARSAGDFQVVGLWVLPCEGSAFFDVGETARFSDAPVTGEVATEGSPPKALRCFTETCALPPGTCPQAVNGAPVLRRCEGGGPVSDADLARPTGAAPSGAGLTTVMVGGKAVMAVRTTSTAAPAGSTAAPAGSTAAPAASQPQAAYAPRAPTTQAQASDSPALTSQAPASQAQSAYAQPIAAPPPPAPRPAADVSPPTPPKGPCGTAAALIQESSRHVDLGNEAEIARDAQTAADEYRAAITMDACNAFAWASLGSLALREGQPGHAASALRVAVRLKPEHYGAATDLGRAYEQLGETSRAVEAYRAALAARPGHPPAAEGLSRLGASPR